MSDSEATAPEAASAETSVSRTGAKAGSWLDNWFEHLPFGTRWPASPLTHEVQPVRVEQYRDEGDLVIRAEMPGIENDEDIDVTLAGDKLTVAAKREHRSETETDGSFRTEFHYGSFSRTVTVPPGIDAKDVSASYDNGILEVRVSVGEDSVDSHKITVARG
jgi:HSP20 family protein